MSITRGALLKKAIFYGAAVTGALALVYAAAVSFAFYKLLTDEPEFGVPVPGRWEIKAESGDIAGICFGSWEECGSITRTYKTNQSPDQAALTLKESLASGGWTMRPGDTRNNGVVINASATNRPSGHTEISYIELSPGEARVKYVRR